MAVTCREVICEGSKLHSAPLSSLADVEQDKPLNESQRKADESCRLELPINNSPSRKSFGFSASALLAVRQNALLAKIVAGANTNLYNLSNSITLERIHRGQLKCATSHEHIFLTDFDSGDDKVEVIKKTDFFEQVLADLGLPPLSEKEKQEQYLSLVRIGALAHVKTDKSQVLRFDVLSAAWLVHGYQFSNFRQLKRVKGLNFNMLSVKSIRIMNRLARVIDAYARLYAKKKGQPVVRDIKTITAIVLSLLGSDIVSQSE